MWTAGPSPGRAAARPGDPGGRRPTDDTDEDPSGARSAPEPRSAGCARASLASPGDRLSQSARDVGLRAGVHRPGYAGLPAAGARAA